MHLTSAVHLKAVLAAVVTRSRVRISNRNGWAQGIEGIALGYRPGWGSVKVGFIDDDGSYTGDWTVVPVLHVETT